MADSHPYLQGAATLLDVAGVGSRAPDISAQAAWQQLAAAWPVASAQDSPAVSVVADRVYYLAARANRAADVAVDSAMAELHGQDRASAPGQEELDAWLVRDYQRLFKAELATHEPRNFAVRTPWWLLSLLWIVLALGTGLTLFENSTPRWLGILGVIAPTVVYSSYVLVDALLLRPTRDWEARLHRDNEELRAAQMRLIVQRLATQAPVSSPAEHSVPRRATPEHRDAD